MRELRAVAQALFILILSHPAIATAEWFYSDLSAASPRQIALSPQHISGHFQSDAQICPEDAPMICFESAGLTFAVPRDLSTQRKWRHGNATYNMLGEARFRLVGQDVSIIWIEQEVGPRHMRFLYSKLRGLVGFQSRHPRGPLFLLENGCGFGASSTCIDNDPNRD